MQNARTHTKVCLNNTGAESSALAFIALADSAAQLDGRSLFDCEFYLLCISTHEFEQLWFTNEIGLVHWIVPLFYNILWYNELCLFCFVNSAST
jgi:hypothetical protein